MDRKSEYSTDKLLKCASYNIGNRYNSWIDKIKQIKSAKISNFYGVELDDNFYHPKTKEDEVTYLRKINDICSNLMDKIFKDFDRENYDIICLQEVPDLKSLESYLNGTHFDIRICDKSLSDSAIIYNCEKFRFISEKIHRSSELYNIITIKLYDTRNNIIIQVTSIHLTGYHISSYTVYQEEGFNDLMIALGMVYSNNFKNNIKNFFTKTAPMISIIAGDFNSPPEHGYPKLMQENGFIFNQHDNIKTMHSGEIDHVYLKNIEGRSKFIDHIQDSLSIKFLSNPYIGDGFCPYGPSDHIPRFFTIQLG